MKNTPKLDTLYKVETPEGVNLVFRPASPIIRSLALVCDICFQVGILIGLYIILILISSLFGLRSIRYSIGLFTLASFIIYWWYFVLFEVLNNGQSLGKRIFGLKVIHDDGTPIGWSASLLRNLLRAVDLLPSFLYGVGLIAGLTSNGFKRLGDIAAGTLVIYTEQISGTLSLPELPETAIPFSFTPEEQKMILAFAERRTTFSQERRLELASILSEHFNLDPHQNEQMLYSIALHSMGSSTIKKRAPK